MAEREVATVLAIVLEIAVLLVVPATLVVCAILNFEQSALLTFAVTVLAIGFFFLDYERTKPGLRQIVPTVVLAALAAAGRLLFAAIPDFKPVSAICIIAGSVFGRRSGFMVGALAALTSNFFFGQGAWTPWQMYAWGLVGYFAGVLGRYSWFNNTPFLLTYGFISAMLFGLLLNGWYVICFVHPITWQSVLAAYAAGFPFDCVHGAATVAFLLALYVPWRRKLKRIQTKYEL